MNISNLESGLFHKGEHKIVYAYSAQTVCDAHGWILGYTIHLGTNMSAEPSISSIKKSNHTHRKNLLPTPVTRQRQSHRC